MHYTTCGTTYATNRIEDARRILKMKQRKPHNRVRMTSASHGAMGSAGGTSANVRGLTVNTAESTGIGLESPGPMRSPINPVDATQTVSNLPEGEDGEDAEQTGGATMGGDGGKNLGDVYGSGGAASKPSMTAASMSENVKSSKAEAPVFKPQLLHESKRFQSIEVNHRSKFLKRLQKEKKLEKQVGSVKNEALRKEKVTMMRKRFRRGKAVADEDDAIAVMLCGGVWRHNNLTSFKWDGGWDHVLEVPASSIHQPIRLCQKPRNTKQVAGSANHLPNDLAMVQMVLKEKDPNFKPSAYGDWNSHLEHTWTGGKTMKILVEGIAKQIEDLVGYSERDPDEESDEQSEASSVNQRLCDHAFAVGSRGALADTYNYHNEKGNLGGYDDPVTVRHVIEYLKYYKKIRPSGHAQSGSLLVEGPVKVSWEMTAG